MLKEITRFRGVDTPEYGTATAEEAMKREQKALRVTRLSELKITKAMEHAEWVKLSILEERFDDIADAISAADAQFEADNKAFLKKHRPVGGAS